MPMVNDNRIFDRFQVRFPVRFKDAREDYGNDVFLRDISAAGVNIHTKNRLFFNDSIDLEIELPDGNDPLALNGRVMWSKPANESSMWDIGLRFKKVDFMNIQRIFKYTYASL